MKSVLHDRLPLFIYFFFFENHHPKSSKLFFKSLLSKTLNKLENVIYFRSAQNVTLLEHFLLKHTESVR